MNTINENEVRLANLKAVAEMRRDEFCCIHARLIKQMATIIEDAVAASGVSGYALQKDNVGELYDIDYMRLGGEIDGKRLHSVDLYFRHESWNDTEEGKPRILSLNPCCFGTFNAGNKCGVAYFVLMGYLAAHLQEIQDALNAIPEWEAYTRARRVYTVSRGEVEESERKLAEEAKTARRAEIEKRLVVGAEVVVGYESKWDYEKGDITKGVRVLTVEKVTNKLIFFKDDRQYKKDYVLLSLARGIDNGGFSYLADIDLTNREISRPVSR